MPFTPTSPEREHEQVKGERRYDERIGRDSTVVEDRAVEPEHGQAGHDEERRDQGRRADAPRDGRTDRQHQEGKAGQSTGYVQRGRLSTAAEVMPASYSRKM